MGTHVQAVEELEEIRFRIQQVEVSLEEGTFHRGVDKLPEILMGERIHGSMLEGRTEEEGSHQFQEEGVALLGERIDRMAAAGCCSGRDSGTFSRRLNVKGMKKKKERGQNVEANES